MAIRTETKDRRHLHLKERGFDLLWLLAGHLARLVTQRMILKSIWGATHVEDSQYLRVNLRQKLGNDAEHPHYIMTEPGIGYRFFRMTSRGPVRQASREYEPNVNAGFAAG